MGALLQSPDSSATGTPLGAPSSISPILSPHRIQRPNIYPEDVNNRDSAQACYSPVNLEAVSETETYVRVFPTPQQAAPSV